ncbi:MAG: hypothetical protein WDM76_07145 [Limisphaerales bacterium]
MEEATASISQLATTSKHFARRLLTIGENRLELLAVEVQEERERLCTPSCSRSAWRPLVCWPVLHSRRPSWSGCGPGRTWPSF